MNTQKITEKMIVKIENDLALISYDASGYFCLQEVTTEIMLASSHNYFKNQYDVFSLSRQLERKEETISRVARIEIQECWDNRLMLHELPFVNYFGFLS